MISGTFLLLKKPDQYELHNHVTTLIFHCAFNIQTYVRTCTGSLSSASV